MHVVIPKYGEWACIRCGYTIPVTAGQHPELDAAFRDLNEKWKRVIDPIPDLEAGT